ncbi:TPA: hypothetical protein DIV45_01395 [Patescibacteria group bacterium]|uniref:Glycosyltransferase subfamily 4-like N-terminal domain-containing protein n=1 Tax=Candidatus Woykebacteria bacterium GWA1_44_8 TaxID=1802591 RepID=A0A1G1W4U8_9BACT|nr:MAG: hypothetical protein A2113_00425 [Candidatus Woykebacteria bacterium GWA1_44_8]HCR42003.1 hypothetical protein [Patescibacteria group bacterium]
MMKHVLVISYFFPPIYSVESTMALNSVKYLSLYGWEPTVISAVRSEEFGKDLFVSVSFPEVKIMRTFSWENFISRAINWLGVVSDAMFGWAPFAWFAIRSITSSLPIEAIISRANPITSHLVAFRLKRQLGIQVPWVVLFGDPWTQNPYVKYRWPWVKPYRERIEKTILQEADAIVVTTELTKQLLVSKYGLADKIHVLPNTYDPAEFVNLVALPVPYTDHHQTMVLTYAGNLYGLRSPEPLFRALQIICQKGLMSYKQIKVRLIGSVGEFTSLIDQYQLQDMVEVVGNLPRYQTLQELSHSDVLLSIDAALPAPSIFLPAKLMDYLALNKPILAVTPVGETANLIKRTGSGFVVSPEDPTAIALVIEEMYLLFSQGKLVTTYNKTEVNRYSALDYGKQLTTLLDQLVVSKIS